MISDRPKWETSNQIIQKIERPRPFSSLSNYSPEKKQDFRMRPVSASVGLVSKSSSIQQDIAAFYEARERLQAKNALK